MTILPEQVDEERLAQDRRRAIVLIALLPLTMLLAERAGHALGDRLLGFYGVGVLGATGLVMLIAFTRYRDPAERAVPPGVPLPLVSAMVAVRDDVAAIEPCVRSLVQSDHPHLEVIVVDDCSTDGTGDVLRRLQAELGFELLTMTENVGKKAALTHAARRSRGEVLVFTDSDCVLAPDAISRCVRALMADPDLGALSGHARARNASCNRLTRMQDVWYDGQFGVSKAAEASYGAVSCVSGPLAAFRREAVIGFLPAWANDRFAGREFRFATDRQLTGYVLCQPRCVELMEPYRDDPLVAGERHDHRRWKVGYSRSARVVTDVPETFRALLRQQARWKKSFVRSMFFTGRHYWRRGFIPALLFYGHAMWVLMAPLMVFRHLVWLPVQGVWAGMALYLAGVTLKGGAWAIAYKAQHKDDPRWIHRPAMSLLSALVLSWLLPYSILTLRRMVWARSASGGRSAAPAAAPRPATGRLAWEGQ